MVNIIQGDKMMILSSKTFGERLNFIMKENKITNKAMSELLSENYNYSISKESIAKYRNDERTPEPLLIKFLSDILSVSTDYLLGIDEKPATTVPIIGVASCGGKDLTRPLSNKKSAYYNADKFNSSMFCVIARGNGMSPEVDDGDEVICDPLETPVHGDLVYYKYNGENAIKVLTIDEEANIVQLVPYTSTDNFKTTTVRMDDETYSDLIMTKVVSVNKLKFTQNDSRLKMIGRT